MSGHSKWSTIKRQKGAADIKRGMTFTKLANAITIATRLGNSGDVDANPRLRVAVDLARAVNMPKENVERAIDRGLGKLAGQTLEEVIYEGFGPGKVAFYIEAVTDNKMRTLQEMRNLFERSGGNLGGQGSTAYLFSQVGEIKIRTKGASIEDEILELIDLGAEDVEDYKDEENLQHYLVYVKSPELNTMSKNITQVGYEVESAEIVYKPTMTVDINEPELAKKILDFAGKLEEHDDIQKVYTNFEIV
ncbi:YebC/PmpR family DNA-binding transcriptional regulator [Candidatus Daviesbacteria bacterium]|nr:YebC/PmpR family DNA-binding transcriptional regulator [Candidatus Daviesbacteria bacterium]